MFPVAYFSLTTILVMWCAFLFGTIGKNVALAMTTIGAFLLFEVSWGFIIILVLSQTLIYLVASKWVVGKTDKENKQ